MPRRWFWVSMNPLAQGDGTLGDGHGASPPDPVPDPVMEAVHDRVLAGSSD